MRMRRRVISGMLALMLALSAAAGAEYTINDDYVGTPPATWPAGTYPTLEDLRGVVLNPGDIVVLHNNDNTLLGPLDWNGITIRSAGNNRFTVSPRAGITPAWNTFTSNGTSPSLEMDSLHIVASGDYNAIISSTHTPAVALSGTVAVTDSVLEYTGTLGSGVLMYDVKNGTFVNTQILGTATSLRILNTAILGAPSDLTIQFNRDAGMYNRWDGTLSVTNSSLADINIDVAEGKYFSIGNVVARYATMMKTGGGTLKIGAGNNTASRLTIDRGTVHFNERSNWVGENIHVGANGVFKPSIDFYRLAEWVSDPDATPNPGDRSRFILDTFTSEEGARLEIGNVSTLPDYRSVNLISGTHNMFTLANAAGSNFASTLRIENKLMTAYIEERTDAADTVYPPGYYLYIGSIRNLDTLEGIGDYADAYRLNPNLSELERDMLDSIYARGGVGEYRGYLQTLGGAIIQNSLLAVRHQHNNINGQINRRLTAYQTEELANIPSYLGDDEAPAYAEEDPVTSYSETWAFLDHGWALQEDVGNEAAYSMGLTTLGIGHDWHADQWIYGGMLAYSTGSMKLENLEATRNDMDFLTAAAYVSWAEDGWYLSGTGTITYGWNSAHSAYTLPGVTLASDSDFSTTGLGFNLEAGHMLETEVYGFPLRVTPYGSLTYTRAHRESVDDTGARNAALGIDLRKHFGAVDWNVWDASLGFRVAVPMEIEGMTVVPSVDVSYTHTAGKESSDGVVHMYSHPSAGWNPGLMESSRSAIRVAAGVEARIRENVSLGAGCEFEWRKLYWNNRLNVNVSIDF